MNKPLIIPFFIPHAGCPFTCVYCNQFEISGSRDRVSPEEIAPKTMEYIRNTNGIPLFSELAYYGGSFTGLPRTYMEELLKEASLLKQKGVIDGIRLSTRPDYINHEILQILSDYEVTTIELGVQSLDDDVLLATGRGHTVLDVINATALIREKPFTLIYQLMPGLPGDTPEKARQTAIKTVQAKPDGVRIYPTVVLEGTTLAKWYAEGKYKPWSLQTAIDVSADWLGLFSLYKIPVIRIGLQASENLTPEGGLVAGPYHPAFGEMVKSRLFYMQITELIKKIRLSKIVILCNPLDLSIAAGQKKENIHRLKSEYGFTDVVIQADAQIGRSDVVCRIGDSQYVLKRQEFLEKYRI